ncbi:MAG: bacteriohemerythrin [gamma proteobacterium symbiont of Taylorina sp.]|nr:bacteriohemerythrin [gamma proteobacterium symbiont of Taylorina sp.]
MKLALPKNCITGIKKIDTQHQKLVDAINDLDKAIILNKNNHIVSGILEQMTQYVETHFLDEEEMLRRCQYPRLKEHQQCHSKFIKQIKLFQKMQKQGLPNIETQIFIFLKEWVFIHIKHTDMAYLTHIKLCSNSARVTTWKILTNDDS